MDEKDYDKLRYSKLEWADRENSEFQRLPYGLDDEIEKFGIEKTIIKNPRSLNGICTLENSILSKLRHINDDSLDCFLCSWLEDSINYFKVYKYELEINIANSINPKRMIKIELNLLNRFFETGFRFRREAHHSRRMTEKMYNMYSSLLYGKYAGLIEVEDTICLDNFEQTRHKDKADYFKALRVGLPPKWWLSIQLQSVLWINEYLEKITDNDIEKIILKYETVNPFDDLIKGVRAKGFKLAKPEILPELHKALIHKNLISGIEYDDFEKAFVNGQGSIQWLTASQNANVLGANSLIHFIDRMVSQGLVDGESYITITAKIFIDKNKNHFKHSTLNTATRETPKNSRLLNGIVDSLLIKP